MQNNSLTISSTASISFLTFNVYIITLLRHTSTSYIEIGFSSSYTTPRGYFLLWLCWHITKISALLAQGRSEEVSVNLFGLWKELLWLIAKKLPKPAPRRHEHNTVSCQHRHVLSFRLVPYCLIFPPVETIHCLFHLLLLCVDVWDPRVPVAGRGTRKESRKTR